MKHGGGVERLLLPHIGFLCKTLLAWSPLSADTSLWVSLGPPCPLSKHYIFINKVHQRQRLTGNDFGLEKKEANLRAVL